MEKNRKKSATTYKSYDDSNIDDKEQVRDLGIMMSKTATFTLHIRHIVKKARDKMGLVLRVFQSLMLTLLKSLESIESEGHTSYRSYPTNVYIQNH